VGLVLIQVAKMHGCGNDFLIFPFQSMPDYPNEELVRFACDRKRGIGADGAIFLAKAIGGVRMDYYNSDGTQARMCFNGARCAAWRAHNAGYAGKTMQLQTGYGHVAARVSEDIVELTFLPPNTTVYEVALPGASPARHGYMAPIADPHLIVPLESKDFDSLNFLDFAKPLRWNKRLFPDGTNVHAVCNSGQQWRIRSFERGIEGETEACGSGCVAAALALDLDTATFVTAAGDEIIVSTGPTQWSLTGAVVFVANIELHAPETLAEGVATINRDHRRDFRR
jgi:diaminopimelate epimerase